MTAPPTELLRLARSMREAANAGRDVVPVDGFTLFLSRDDPHPQLSVAVPDEDPPEDWGAALAGLLAAFAGRGYVARVEAFAELHPGLWAAADAGGWRRAMTAPVMALSAEAWRRRAAEGAAAVPATSAQAPGATAHGASVDEAPVDRLVPSDAPRYRPLAADDRVRLEAALRGAHRAFGGDEGDPAALAWLPQLLRGLRAGATLGGAVDVAGVPLAGAVVQRGGDAGELVGVWTHPDHRRRGLARLACRALLADAFEAGARLVWLSAAEGALGLYASLGFERVGTQINLEAPS